MASFGKRQRDQERLAKAAQKRDRRQGRQSSAAAESDPESDSGTTAGGESDNQAILAQIEALHRDFEAHRINFDDYEKQRDELLEQIRI